MAASPKADSPAAAGQDVLKQSGRARQAGAVTCARMNSTSGHGWSGEACRLKQEGDSSVPAHPQHKFRHRRLHRHPGSNIRDAPVRCCGCRSPCDIAKLSLKAARPFKLELPGRDGAERPQQCSRLRGGSKAPNPPLLLQQCLEEGGQSRCAGAAPKLRPWRRYSWSLGRRHVAQ